MHILILVFWYFHVIVHPREYTMNSDGNHSQQGETKRSTTAATTSPTTTSAPGEKAAQHPSYFVQSELIPKEYRDQTICSNLRGNLENYWLMIYAYLDFSYADRLELRWMCRLFHEVEKILTLNKHRYVTLTPLPKYTTFPHPKYPTLNELMDELNTMYIARPDIVWEKCTAPDTLCVGTVVLARFANASYNFVPAKINQINNNQINKLLFRYETTVDIVYDNGNTRMNVPLREIQIQNVSV